MEGSGACSRFHCSSWVARDDGGGGDRGSDGESVVDISGGLVLGMRMWEVSRSYRKRNVHLSVRWYPGCLGSAPSDFRFSGICM